MEQDQNGGEKNVEEAPMCRAWWVLMLVKTMCESALELL